MICDFSEGAGNDREKEIKRQATDLKLWSTYLRPDIHLNGQTLLELVDYVNSAKHPCAEHIMPEVVNMVRSALCCCF